MKYALTLMAALLTTPLAAHDYTIGDVSIKHPVSYPTTGRSGAGYMMIESTGASDRLIAVEGDFPRVMIHATVMEDGIAKMRHQMAVDIPAGEMVEFAPGGLHVMFMGLKDNWNVGDEIPATLVFENAGRLEVTFNVEERPMAGMKENAQDHSNH